MLNFTTLPPIGSTCFSIVHWITPNGCNCVSRHREHESSPPWYP